jgi:thiamine-monophosphate kinase
MRDESQPLLLRDLGEQGLLERLHRFCPPQIIGDDAAVIPAPEPGQLLVVTTDTLVNEVHFSDRTTSPEDVGWRATAANLSDLAAMGASSLGITVGLMLAGDVAVDWLERLYRGIADCLHQYNTSLLGGDVCRSPTIAISITAFGRVSPQHVLRRSAARVGDAIVVTGVHGASRAGLELLLHPELEAKLTVEERTSLIRAHQRPLPRLDVLPVLWEIVEAHPEISARPLAGMDSSDGLADTVCQICRASGVGAQIERTQIPLPPSLNRLVSPEQAMDWVLYGGEDFELVLCLSLELAEALVGQLGEGAAIIGAIASGNEVCLTDSSGLHAEQMLTLSRGFQHFGH